MNLDNLKKKYNQILGRSSGAVIKASNNAKRSITDAYKDILQKPAQRLSTAYQQKAEPLRQMYSPESQAQARSTIRQTPSTLADFTFREPLRAFGEIEKTLLGDQASTDTLNPKFKKFLFGEEELKSFKDPTRDSNRFARWIGHEELGVPLAVGSAFASIIPDLGKKKVGEELVTSKAVKEVAEEVLKPSSLKRLWNRLAPSVEGALSKTPSGAEFAKKYSKARDEATLLAGKYRAPLDAMLSKLNKEELADFVDVVEGRKEASTEALKMAATKWQEVAQDIARQAQEAGIKVRNAAGELVDFTPRSDYFPHIVPEEFITNKTKRKELLQRLVQSGWAKSLDEAEVRFQELVGKGPRKSSFLEKTRLDFPEFEKDPRKVIPNYIEDTTRRLEFAKEMGLDNEKAYELIRRAGEESGNPEDMKRFADRILETEDLDELSEKISAGLRGLQAVTKLGTAAITNLGQSTSTAMRTSIWDTAAAIGDVTGKNRQEAKRFATLTGEILNSAQRELARQAGGDIGFVGNFLRKTGFNASEEFNRRVAANAGRRHTEYLIESILKNPANKSAKRGLEALGLNVEKIIQGGKVMQDDLVRGAKRVVQDTQFATDAFDLPYAWTSPYGRVLTQFKSFAYKQTKFLAQHTKKVAVEAKNGNLKPLVNTLVVMGVAAPIIGEIQNDIKSVLNNKQRTDKGTERYINNLLSAVSAGLLSDAYTIQQGKYGTQGTIGALAGPTVSDTYELGTALRELGEDRKSYEGKDEVISRIKPITRELVSRIPIIGKTASNTFIPNQYVDSYVGINQKDEEGERPGDLAGSKLFAPKPSGRPAGSMQGIAPDPSTPVGAMSATSKTDSVLQLFGWGDADEAEAANVPDNIIEAQALYKDYMSDIEKYEVAKAKVEFGNYKSGDIKEKLQNIESDYNHAQMMVESLENEYPQLKDEMLSEKYGVDKVTKMGSSDTLARLQKESESYKVSNKVMADLNSGELDQDQANTLLGKIGIPEADAEYYYVASQPEAVRSQLLLELGSSFENRDEFLTYLLNSRMVINGKKILTNAIVDDLEAEGLITDAEGKFIKGYENGKKKTSSSGGSKKAKKRVSLIKGKAPKKVTPRTQKLTVTPVSANSGTARAPKRKIKVSVQRIKNAGLNR